MKTEEMTNPNSHLWIKNHLLGKTADSYECKVRINANIVGLTHALKELETAPTQEVAVSTLRSTIEQWKKELDFIKSYYHWDKFVDGKRGTQTYEWEKRIKAMAKPAFRRCGYAEDE